MQIKIPLDRILSIFFSQKEGTEEGKVRPDEKLRFSLLGEEPDRHPLTPLTLSLSGGENEIHITGKCDAVFAQNGRYLVEEEVLVDQMVHFAALRERALVRAKFFALALASTKKLPEVTLCLSVFGEGRVEMEKMTLTKEQLMGDLTPYIQRIFSLSPLFADPESRIAFPYPSLREGQKKLIRASWNAIKSRTNLMACAPTGIGKTLAVLYPALRAIETGKADRIFYASPKNTLKRQAAAAVETLQQVKGLRTLVMSAKMSLCPEKREECRGEGCPYTENMGERMSDALQFLSSFSCITEKELVSAARSFSLCPFELALKMQSFCQVIIGDYNHVFDPSRRIVSPGGRDLLLVDEAHNLPTRIRENFTEHLSPRDLDYFFRSDSPASTMLREHFAPLTALFAKIDQVRQEKKEYHHPAPPKEVAEAAKALLPKLGFALHGGFGPMGEEEEREIRNLFGKIKKFSSLFRIFNEDFATIFPPEGGCKIHLVDPRQKIRAATDPWRSTLFFSATLSPQEYYFKLLSDREEDLFLHLPSPFPKENFFVGICHVDVSYSQRYATAPKICNIIRSAVSAKEGNYMVFLPSFEYLNLVSQEYKKRFFDTRVLVQERVMTKKGREEFLKAFEEKGKGTLIGFCVMGGIFSEGVDLKGERLLGEIVVGTGFPPPSPEAEAECEAYVKKEMDGRKFAYTLPGWNRVLQAAGRVIRSEEDRGFLILCDARYQGEDMKELFPESWEGAAVLERSAQIRSELELFWS